MDKEYEKMWWKKKLANNDKNCVRKISSLQENEEKKISFNKIS